MAVDFGKIGIDAGEGDNLTVDKKFERELPREGIAMLRYVGYIETGKHLPKNPKHNAALKCIHIFELNHPDHLIELEDGTKVPQKMFVHQNKGTTAASGYRKLFNVMNKAYKQKYNHFVQMLGQGFLADVSHNTYQEKKYANLHVDGAWSLRAPVMVNVMDNTITPVPIPEPKNEILGFLWENDAISDTDVKAMWETLFIEGERDDGSSKNWMQETISDNIEWEGSRTQSLTEEFVGLGDYETDGSHTEVKGLKDGASTDASAADLAALGTSDVPF